MKNSIFAFLCLALLASVAIATTTHVDNSIEATVSSSAAANDILGITPFWFDVSTGAFCAPNGTPYPCTSNFDCHVYYGLSDDYVCDNPQSRRCGGQCIPC